MQTQKRPVLEFKRVNSHFGQELILKDVNWRIEAGEHWAIMGHNGSGKSTLAKILAGKLPAIGGQVLFEGGAGHFPSRQLVSFEKLQNILGRIRMQEELNCYSGQSNKPILLEDVLYTFEKTDNNAAEPGDEIFGIADKELFKRDLRTLSAGEVRKLLIMHLIRKRPEILILDEPFENLDAPGRTMLTAFINKLLPELKLLVVISHRMDEIPAAVTHVLGLKAGRTVFALPRAAAMSAANLQKLFSPPPLDGSRFCPLPKGQILVELVDGHVRYGAKTVLQNMHMTIYENEHWAITGPVGAGKTSLLTLITGDHPQSFANNIRLFGKKRGSGETLWDLKKVIGYVSFNSHLTTEQGQSALQIVLSGFFGTNGLFKTPHLDQIKAAESWLERFGMRHLSQRAFRTLSYGEQKRALLARAMAKQPRLLVLDEPFCGLDMSFRIIFKNELNRIAAEGLSTILMVSHHEDDLPECISRHVRLAIRYDT